MTLVRKVVFADLVVTAAFLRALHAPSVEAVALFVGSVFFWFASRGQLEDERTKAHARAMELAKCEDDAFAIVLEQIANLAGRVGTAETTLKDLEKKVTDMKMQSAFGRKA